MSRLLKLTHCLKVVNALRTAEDVVYDHLEVGHAKNTAPVKLLSVQIATASVVSSVCMLEIEKLAKLTPTARLL